MDMLEKYRLLEGTKNCRNRDFGVTYKMTMPVMQDLQAERKEE